MFASILGFSAKSDSAGIASVLLPSLQGDTVFVATLGGEFAWPFAAYYDGEWTYLSWYEPPPELAIAGSVWYGRSFSGETLVLKGLEIVPIEGSAAWYGGEWALRTDYDHAGAKERLVGTGVRSGGILVTKPLPITVAVEVGPESETASDLQAAAEGRFGELETAWTLAFVYPEGYPTFPATAAERAQFPIKTTRVQKVSLSSDQDLFLHRARREYGRWEQLTDGTEKWVCYGLTDTESWILRREGDLRFISGEVNRSNCAEYGAYETAVYGALELDGTTYLVLEGLGYEGSSKAIHWFTGDTVSAVVGQF